MIWLEALSYVVTILGFPAAIAVFWHEHRRRIANEDSELHRTLSEEYDNFLRLVLDNADLQLVRQAGPLPGFSAEQAERREIIFRMLVSLFEKAYIILYTDNMDRDATRRWRSWEDDMREWCRLEAFRELLPGLLDGEDEEFSEHILAISTQQAAA